MFLDHYKSYSSVQYMLDCWPVSVLLIMTLQLISDLQTPAVSFQLLTLNDVLTHAVISAIVTDTSLS